MTTAPGRNDPCPCGSGKKYKKCHLDADETPRREAAAIESVHVMDFRLVDALVGFAARLDLDWLGADWDEIEEDAHPLVIPWSAWTNDIEGGRIADLYLEQHRAHLSAEEREWFAAQKASWLSIWEVTGVEPGRIEVRDLLTDETRSVREDLGSRSVGMRDTLLARVIDYRGSSYFGGMYARALPPMSAAEVIEEVRAELRMGEEPAPVELLRDRETGWLLIDCWEAAVEARLAPPALQNSDGDPVRFVTDSFTFDPELREEIEKRLEAMEGFDSASADQGERVHVFLRDDTVIGHVRVGPGTLQIATNSENRADAFVRRVENTCAGMLSDWNRSIDDEPFDEPFDEPAEEPSADAEGLLREYKEKYYDRWLDLPLPALDGKTPRDAVRAKDSRRELELILRQIENAESRQPENERFDVSRLWRELGLEQ